VANAAVAGWCQSKCEFLGRVGSVVQVDSVHTLLRFHPGEQSETFEKGHVESVDFLNSTCLGQDLRVRDNREAVEEACDTHSFVQDMAKHVGTEGQVVCIERSKIKLKFKGGKSSWWAVQALEILPHPSGLPLRTALCQIGPVHDPVATGKSCGGGARASGGVGGVCVWEFEEGVLWKEFAPAVVEVGVAYSI